MRVGGPPRTLRPAFSLPAPGGALLPPAPPPERLGFESPAGRGRKPGQLGMETSGAGGRCPVQEQRARWERKRTCTARELLQTERRYQEQLGLVATVRRRSPSRMGRGPQGTGGSLRGRGPRRAGLGLSASTESAQAFRSSWRRGVRALPAAWVAAFSSCSTSWGF